ncbi:hypothetical protein FB451DRAFT_525295 [Mycena latifolia]|nr:hypothetical protein FB451DRAFT_525295 [Mycena latifolia]
MIPPSSPVSLSPNYNPSYLTRKFPKMIRRTVNLLSDPFERGTNLRSLTLSFTSTHQILRHRDVPALVVLELMGCAVKIQPLIHGTTGSTPLCPGLKTLRLHSCTLIDGTSILEFIIARQQSDKCRIITTLCVSQCKSICARDIMKVQEAGGPALEVDYSQ